MSGENILKIYDTINTKDEELISRFHVENEQFFDIAVMLLKLAYDILPLRGERLSNDIQPHVRRTLLALYTQSFRLFRSIIILCKSGLDREALIQLRSMLEVVTYLLYIAEKDHQDRLEHYLHSRALSKKVAIDDYLSCYPEDRLKVNKEWYEERYEEALKYFKSKHGDCITLGDIKKKYTLRANMAANSISKDIYFKERYRIFHRHASAISHGEDILEYIKFTNKINDTKTFLLEVAPTKDWIKFCLAESMVLIFFAISRINELLKIGKDAVIKDMDLRLDTFLLNNYKKPLLEDH